MAPELATIAVQKTIGWMYLALGFTMILAAVPTRLAAAGSSVVKRNSGAVGMALAFKRACIAYTPESRVTYTPESRVIVEICKFNRYLFQKSSGNYIVQNTLDTICLSGRD